MKTTENVKLSISLLILNDLRHAKVIGDDIYDRAVRKLCETDPRLRVPIATKKESRN